MKTLQTVVMISGGGRTLANLIELSRRGELPIEVVLVISSRAEVRGLEIAREAGIPTLVVSRRECAEPQFSERINEAIDRVEADLILLAGYLCKWEIPSRYLGKVLNIHPALLPKFGGRGMHGHHVHEAVLKAGETVSGCTVHLADNEYDAGPVVLQRTVPVLPGDTPDTLAARVFEQECVAYPEAIRLFALGQVPPFEQREPLRKPGNQEES